MQRLKTYTLTPAAADADGICQSQTPGAGGAQNLTLNGALTSGGVATLDVQRHVIITSAADDHARTFTVYGVDGIGHTISEAVTGVSGGAASTTKNFKTVTRVATDDDTAGAVTVGTNGAMETAWYPVDRYDSYGYGFGVDITGIGNYTVQHAYDDPFPQGPITPSMDFVLKAYDHADVAGKTTDQHGSYDMIAETITAMRLKINSYSTGASFVFRIVPGTLGC